MNHIFLTIEVGVSDDGSLKVEAAYNGMGIAPSPRELSTMAIKAVIDALKEYANVTEASLEILEGEAPAELYDQCSTDSNEKIH